jgi:hypothetical protein
MVLIRHWDRRRKEEDMSLVKVGPAVVLLLGVTSVARGAPQLVTPIMDGPSAGVACHLLLLPSQTASKTARVELMEAGIFGDPASVVGDSGETTLVPGESLSILSVHRRRAQESVAGIDLHERPKPIVPHGELTTPNRG